MYAARGLVEGMANKEKDRLDLVCLARGLFQSRERARAVIMAGSVRVNGQVLDKPGARISTDAVIEVMDEPHSYVSRGGLKLAHALSTFGIDVQGATAIDVGASTGGFTDCLLKNGAAVVYAVDVGYGQLAWELRSDPRVIVMEKTNARFLRNTDVAPCHIATVDVSFISLKLILPPLFDIVIPGGDIVALVKPQFEAGRERIGKGGVVRDAEVHFDVLKTLVSFVSDSDRTAKAICPSPVRGPKGNVEFLLHIINGPCRGGVDIRAEIERAVQEAHVQSRGRTR